MKLSSLKIKSAFGYLNFNIKFDKELTFLVGINGCGKTTVLHLLEALLTPSLQLLDRIPHEKAELRIRHNNRIIKIQSSVTQDTTTIEIPSIEGDNVLSYQHAELTRGASPEAISERQNLLLAQFSKHPVFEFLQSELDTPLFLGLDRRNVVLHYDDISARHATTLETRKREMFIQSVKRRMPISGQLGASLVNVQFLIQEIYRTTREEQDKFGVKLREDIFLAAFDLHPSTSFFKMLHQEGAMNVPFLASIIQKRQHVEGALKNAGLDEEKYRPIVKKFFSHIEGLHDRATKTVQSKDSELPDITIELALNRPVVDRVIKLIESSENYTKNIRKIWEPIDLFLSLVNRFLEDSGKRLEIDQVGWLNVKLINIDVQPRSLDVLSSGERQIVVILAHLAINREFKRAGIFIVDEPELSLHLKWQEIFVDSLLRASPGNQFILATHSPAIVMEREEYCQDLSPTPLNPAPAKTISQRQ
ncbi:MAG: AAA family ATPase [Nitrosomonadales bacterium]|nr:AAA family ATPase [Nitrosomonadales bacterium]